MKDNYCKDIGKILNVAITMGKSLDEIFDLDDPCKCVDLYNELLRETLIGANRVRDGLFDVLNKYYDNKHYTLLLLARYRAIEVRLLIEAILEENICKNREDACYVLYTLRDVHTLVCEIGSELAFVFGECEKESGWSAK